MNRIEAADRIVQLSLDDVFFQKENSQTASLKVRQRLKEAYRQVSKIENDFFKSSPESIAGRLAEARRSDLISPDRASLIREVMSRLRSNDIQLIAGCYEGCSDCTWDLCKKQAIEKIIDAIDPSILSQLSSDSELVGKIGNLLRDVIGQIKSDISN